MRIPILVTLSLLWLLSACEPDVGVKIPEDFPALPVPAANPLTSERVALGKRLFFEDRLSRTGEVSCSSCHQQEHAFADPDRVSEGVGGRRGDRNAPPLFNLAWNTSFFWDGRSPTLEHQVLGPIENPLEMDLPVDEAVTRLRADASYSGHFERAFNRPPDAEGIGQAIASFMRTMVSGNSRYDRFQRGDTSALSESERRGQEVFFSERAECFHCHVGFNLTNNAFHNNGTRPDDPDFGRERVTGRPSDRGKFKVPSLRNVAVTAPYMHDGSLAALENVVEHYVQGGQGHPNTDATLHPLDLTEREKADLVAFLKALTDSDFLKDPRFRPR